MLANFDRANSLILPAILGARSVESPSGRRRTEASFAPPPSVRIPSLLYYRGLLYSLLDNGVLICLDGKTGTEQYRERLGGNCNSTPVASDGRIYLSNNDGKTFVVRAGATFELLATNDLGERITASPAISGDDLIYRTDSHLFRIGAIHAD